MSEGPAFDRVGDNFLEYYSSMRGYVRRELTRQYLIDALEESGPMAGRLADVGSGDAADTRFLLESGYEFEPTAIDPSKEMLAKARKKVPGIKAVHGTVRDASRRKSLRGAFDLVLSHGVLEYDVESPSDHIRNLVSLGSDGAAISILTKGYAGGLDRLMREGADSETIATYKQTGISRNRLGVLTVALRYEEIEEMLRDAGATVMQFCGVRIDSDADDRQWREVKYPDRLKILEAEYASGKHRHLKHRGQMLHVIAAKVRS